MSNMSDTLDELFGLHPSTWTLVRKTADTILHLAELGNVVIIGRGANIITKNLDSAFHVRLVGSETKRIEHLRAYKHLSLGAASLYLRDEDLGRKRYVKKYYAADIDDPLLYHLVINTDLLSYGEAARTIAEAVRARSEPGSVTANGNRPPQGVMTWCRAWPSGSPRDARPSGRRRSTSRAARASTRRPGGSRRVA